MVFFRYPDTFGSPVDAPRSAIMRALRQLITLPEEQRAEQFWTVKKILAAQDIVGIDLQSKSSVMSMISGREYRASVEAVALKPNICTANSNEHNFSFWLIAHLLLIKISSTPYILRPRLLRKVGN